MNQGSTPIRSVCLAVDEFHPMGGTERQVVELAVELHRRRIPVTVLSRWPITVGNPYVEELRETGIRVLASGWRTGGRDRLRRLPYLWAKARAGWTDIQQVERQLWRWQSARLRRLRSAGFVLHEVPFFGVISGSGRQALAGLGIPLVVTIFGGMHVPTLDIPGVVITADGAPRIEPPGTSFTWIPSIGHRALASMRPDDRRPSSRAIIYGGRLSPEKGVEVLVRAVALMPPGLELVIAGDGPERPRLEHLAGELGVQARFVGALQPAALFTWMRRCDVAAFPGLRDGLPSFVVEALGAGVPVVGTDVGGIPRALADSGGIVVPPGSPRALAEGIQRLLASDQPQLRRQARRAYDERFTPAQVVERYLECYVEALVRAGPRARATSSDAIH